MEFYLLFGFLILPPVSIPSSSPLQKRLQPCLIQISYLLVLLVPTVTLGVLREESLDSTVLPLELKSPKRSSSLSASVNSSLFPFAAATPTWDFVTLLTSFYYKIYQVFVGVSYGSFIIGGRLFFFSFHYVSLGQPSKRINLNLHKSY